MRNQADDHTQQLRSRIKGLVADYKRGLANWSELNTCRGDAQCVTIAMLETAIEREIDAMGEEDAREYIETVFCRVAAQRVGGGNA